MQLQTREVKSTSKERERDTLRYLRGGGLNTSLCMVGIEGGSVLMVCLVVKRGIVGKLGALKWVWSNTAPCRDQRAGKGGGRLSNGIEACRAVVFWQQSPLHE
jgi:hypothetical protein